MQITTRRRLVSGGAVALIATALSCGIATSAQAATGHSNLGVRNVQVTPTSPATSFTTPGTTGTLTYNLGDGTAVGPITIDIGDTATWAFHLPSGLEFGPNACAPFADPSPFPAAADTDWDCTISADKRGIDLLRKQVQHPATYTTDYNNRAGWSALPVVSTGLVSGGVTATFTPWTGQTTAAGTATGTVPGAVAPLTITGTSTADTAGNIPLNGSSEPGATITVKDSTGAVVGTTTAGADGKWTVKIPKGSKPPLSITQTVGGVESLPVTYDKAPLPVLPALAGAGALVLAGFGGTVLRRRKRQTVRV
jgi:hypothetical protein